MVFGFVLFCAVVGCFGLMVFVSLFDCYLLCLWLVGLIFVVGLIVVSVVALFTSLCMCA